MAAFALSRDDGHECDECYRECCAEFRFAVAFQGLEDFFSYFELLVTDDKYTTPAKNWHLL
jgi:hypothetical protein